jgi:hypothetical protein
MHLIKTKLLVLWERQHMIGFISRSAASATIERRRAQPAFLLRFSDSVLGAVSIVFLDDHGNIDFFYGD